MVHFKTMRKNLRLNSTSDRWEWVLSLLKNEDSWELSWSGVSRRNKRITIGDQDVEHTMLVTLPAFSKLLTKVHLTCYLLSEAPLILTCSLNCFLLGLAQFKMFMALKHIFSSALEPHPWWLCSKSLPSAPDPADGQNCPTARETGN